MLDLAIVGGGPAGSAAAITAAQAGLKVALFEALPFPRFRPGEALHPGAEPILRQLGVWDALLATSPIRHFGHEVEDQSGVCFLPFGGPPEEPWMGLQVDRGALDDILLQRAADAGAQVLQPVRATIMQADGRTVGVQLKGGEIQQAAYVIDASGTAQAARRRLGLGVRELSRPLRAHYGYRMLNVGEEMPEPRLNIGPAGWRWQAQVAADRVQWVQLQFTESKQLERGHPFHARSADVTWRLLQAPAAHGHFVVGDASATLDPASSHGVLRALMTGIQAVHLIAQVLHHKIAEVEAEATYNAWLNDWIEHDARRLEAFYNAYGVEVRRTKD